MNKLAQLKNVWVTGADASSAKYAFLMVHGRGSDVSDMQSLLPTMGPKIAYCVMPQASVEIMPSRYAWYPHFWNENLEENIGHLNNAFEQFDQCIDHIKSQGFKDEQIVLIGHSQGANVLLEYFMANPRPFKAVISFRGILLGNFGEERGFKDKLPKTLVLLHAGRRDPYIPSEKIDQTHFQLKDLGASVHKVLYETSHGICRQELLDVKKLIKKDFNYIKE